MVELCSAAGPVGEAVGRAGAHEVLRCGLGSGKYSSLAIYSNPHRVRPSLLVESYVLSGSGLSASG